MLKIASKTPQNTACNVKIKKRNGFNCHYLNAFGRGNI